MSRLTRTPCDSHRRWTSRLRPSSSTTRYQRLAPSPPSASMLRKRAGPSSRSTAALQMPDRLLVHPAENPNRVLALQPVARVHEPVGELAVGSEEQQARGVDVEPADRDPALGAKAGQALEDRPPALGVAACRHLAGRLMVEEQPARLGGRHEDPAAVDPDPVAGADPGAGGGYASIDPDPTLRNPLVHGSPGAHPGRGEALLDALGGEILDRTRFGVKRPILPFAGPRPGPPARTLPGRPRPSRGRPRPAGSPVPGRGPAPGVRGPPPRVRRPSLRVALASARLGPGPSAAVIRTRARPTASCRAPRRRRRSRRPRSLR